MAFSCSYVLSKLKSEESHTQVPKQSQKLKRPCPFPDTKKDLLNDDIIPEAVDVLDSIFSSLCSFSEEASVSNEANARHEKSSSLFPNGTVKGSESKKTVEGKTVSQDCTPPRLQEESEQFAEVYDFTNIPIQVTGSWKEFMNEGGNNYTRGCKWAPDGSCILTCSNDNILRLFNLPHELWDVAKWSDISEMEAVVKIPEGELIYDYCWYPLMNSEEPSTCCLASSSQNSPVHLWDGFTGELRGSYRCYDQMDEITPAKSLSFDSNGQRLFCGFKKTIRIFNVDLPGRKFQVRPTFAKKSGQPGIISCFAFTPQNLNISVAGCYDKTIGIYSEPDGNLEWVLDGQKGGVTQLQFSPDGNLLYSGGRKDPEILCWDLRFLGNVLYCLRRKCITSQRMYFDISRSGRYVVSGNNNGIISIWDTQNSPKVIENTVFSILEPVQFFLGHNDCVNGISLHPTYPLMCSSSGQRKFPDLLPDEDDNMFASKVEQPDNSLRLWWMGNCS